MSKEFEIEEEIIDSPEEAALAYRECELSWAEGIGIQMTLIPKEYVSPINMAEYEEDGWKLFAATLVSSRKARQMKMIKNSFGLNVGGFEERLWGSTQWSSQQIGKDSKRQGIPVYIAASQIAAIVDGEYKVLLPEISVPALDFTVDTLEERLKNVIFDAENRDPRGTL